jgi:GlpG protein
MRLIGQLPLEKANRFAKFLQQEGIDAQIDPVADESQSIEGLIWIVSEDDVDKANGWFNQYLQNPSDPYFQVELSTSQGSEKEQILLSKPTLSTPYNLPPPINKKKSKTPIIFLLIVASIFIYMVTEWTSPNVPKNIEQIEIPMTFAPPIMKDLLFDWPKAYQLMDQIYASYPLDEIQNTQTWPEDLKTLEKNFQNTQYWKGAYDLVVEEAKKEHPSWDYKGPMFEKIKDGQYYRLFTPALLHGNLLHILFNLMWIVVLGFQIERKIGSLKTLLFVLITGVFSNICQYLMSGPNFLGLSGVVIAMVGFIWIREKKAPWEGYVLHSSTLLFIAIYVFAMFAVQLVSFFFQISGKSSFILPIANTAHIAGGIIGALLGLLPFFERKHHKIKRKL